MSCSLNTLYQVVGISKQAVHKYKKQKALFDEKLEQLLIQTDLLREEHPGCGVRKMYDVLKPDFIGRDRFERLMMDYGYRIKRHKNYIRTTIPAHYRYPNLIEGSIVNQINQVWQSDISYILVNGSYYYLVFIIDVYSRRIVGYQASDHMRTEANVNALRQAFKLRSNDNLSDLIHHSDRGSQYASKPYTNMLAQKGISISMGLKATDNAFAERINGIIKNEYLKYRDMKSLVDLKRELRKAVKHYNDKRTHLNIQKMNPIAYEKKLLDLNDQKKPTVTIYAEGYDKIKEASSLFNLRPEKNLGVHICPIYYDQILLT